MSVDGWCIFRNAAVYEPYCGEADNRGIFRVDPAELIALVGRANRQGLAVAVHAVGARAVDAALDAFEAAGPAIAGPHRIEHAHIDVTGAQLRRMRDLGLVWSAQPALIGPNRRDWEAGLGTQRASRIMALRTALDLGLPIILNSDVPSGPIGPLAAIRAAVTRDAGGSPLGPEQAIPVVDAWRAFTSGPAAVAHEPAAGSLEPGRVADLVVLDGDPFTDTQGPSGNHGDPSPRASNLDAAGIAATIIAGEIVHDPAGITA
jgi:predicted amidohydrolase YtcJ